MMMHRLTNFKFVIDIACTSISQHARI